MITITSSAAKQIRQSAKQGHLEGLALRVAATRNPDGSLHYGMGFDDVGRDDDLKFNSAGIDIVIAPVSMDLLNGTTIDYVELEPGKNEFIFINPNDPTQSAPND